MRFLVVAMLASGLGATTITGCGSDCETAVNKELECMEAGKRKTEFEDMKGEVIARCESKSDDPQMKLLVECGKKSTCENVKACQNAAKEGEAAKEITQYLENGNISEAVSDCSYDLESYQVGGAFKAACDKAFEGAAKKLGDEEVHRKTGYVCTGDDAAEWLKASATLKKTCDAIGASMKKALEDARDADKYDDYECGNYKEFVAKSSPGDKAAAEKFCTDAKSTVETKKAADDKKKADELAAKEAAEKTLKKVTLKKAIETQRDAGTKYDFSACYDYQELAAADGAEAKAAAELLCAESKAAAKFKEAMDEAAIALKEKKTRPPYSCRSVLKRNADKLKASKWFAVKAPILAKACFGGELGKNILGSVTRTLCLSGPKAVHEWATKFNLGATDTDLQALLTKTKTACSK